MRAQLPFALLLATTTFACTTDVTAPPLEGDEDTIVSALEQDDGGFDTTDELPMFDELAAFDQAALESDAALTDELAQDADVAAMEADASADVRDVIVMWGRLPGDPTATDVRDWGGELRLSRGAMYVRRRIALEDAGDRVRPRTRPDVIEFDSRTRPHADGLALRIIDTRPGDAEPLRLTYVRRDGMEREFDLREVDVRPRVADLGDGNRMIVSDHRRSDRPDCEHGFMRGRWHKIAPRAAVFLGVLGNAQGEVTGHVRGIAGQRRNGAPVMFGKFINREGGFKGLIRATLDEGGFEGGWVTRSGEHGTLNGVFFEGASLRAGSFVGRWASAACAR